MLEILSGKSEEECEKHILRYNKKYIPVTIKEQIKILKWNERKRC